MTPDYTNQLAMELLLTSLMGVLAVTLLSGFLVFICLRRRTRSLLLNKPQPQASVSPGPRYLPSVFENNCRWLVAKTTHMGAVQSALGLHNPMPCSWGDGLSRLNHRGLFVSPPIRGWILVVGQGLPDPSDDVDECFHFLLRLSRLLGHVQFFSANRAVNHHGWVRADSGHIRRAYAWAGETLWNQGEPTQAEIDLGLQCLRYCETATQIHLLPGEPTATNAEKVMLLAARWSFDPTTVDESMLRVGVGVAGDLTHSRQH